MTDKRRSASGSSERPLTDDERAAFSWMNEAPTAPVIAALEAAKRGGSRLVGGCVRDALLGHVAHDVDVATILTPEDVVAALRAAGLKAVPTGVDHGTVTAVAEGGAVEVTTLRADVSTDGRRAVVAFTDDWRTDAARRDFTMNALYVSGDGVLFDPFDGLADARAGRVRFIGDARRRIEEDALRVLRFFRFSARFAKSFDADGLAACAEKRALIDGLSAERIGDEMLRLFSAPRASDAIDVMAEIGVLEQVWRGSPQRDVFRKLKEIDCTSSGVVGLAALFPGESADIDARFRLSNAQAVMRVGADLGADEMLRARDVASVRRALYALRVTHGVNDAESVATLALARACVTDGVDPHPELREIAASWIPPTFPVSGKDALALGLAPGPVVSRVLRAVEDQWLAKDFPDADRVQELLAEAVRQEIT